MIRINIITVGTLKEKYWKDAVAEYTKRLGRFAKVQVTELEEAYLPSSPSYTRPSTRFIPSSPKMPAKTRCATRPTIFSKA